MRPRPDAAENPHQSRHQRPRPHRFNEAAARCRGKLLKLAEHDVYLAHLASMRPRPDAAENAARRRRSRTTSSCFNEAAARCRGKHRGVGTPDTRTPQLQ